MSNRKPTRKEYLRYMDNDQSSILGKLDSFPARSLHQEPNYSFTPRMSLRDISTAVERNRPTGLAQQTGFNYNPGYTFSAGTELDTGYSDERQLQLENDFANPVSSESIKEGANRPDLRDELIQESRSEDIRLAVSSGFNTFPDDFLVINDVFLYNVPTAAVSITSRSDVFVGETLRTLAPVIATEGRQDFVLNLSLVFNPGKEQTEDLRRIVSELSRHPLVFIFNNKVRKSIGVSEFTTTMFILEAGTLRSSSESVGSIVLELQLHYFNHLPFSNNFFFNAKMPGISYTSKEEELKLEQNLNLEDLQGFESSDYLLEERAKEVRENIRDNVIQVNDASTKNVPVNFPSESDSWMYYANHLESMSPTIVEDPSDYVGFSVKRFVVKSPPNEAKQGFGTIKGSLVGSVTRPSVKSIYDATKPLPSSTTTQERYVEETTNSNVQPSALEGIPIRFYSYDSGRPDSIILTTSPGAVHEDASRRLSSLVNVGLRKDATPIQPELILHLQRIANRFPGRRILVNDGSRFPKNPDKYYSKPVEKRSKHVTGHAMDFKVEGVSNKELFKFIRTLPNSGAGYYPNSTFCHMDYRTKKSFWIDESGPGEKSSYLKGQERDNYLSQHIYNDSGEHDNIEAEADKISQADKKRYKAAEQQKDIASQKSDQFVKEQEELDKELEKEETKIDESIGHEANDRVKRSWKARADWIADAFEDGWIYYSSDPANVRNVFYKEEFAAVGSSIESKRDPSILKDIVCSAISVQFGHRIAPMRLLSQHAYTYQFLGAGNKSGQMVFTFSGQTGRQSADILKAIFVIARHSARNFGSLIKEAGSIQLSAFNYNLFEQNTILSLLNVDDIIITNIRESSLPDSVDKHQLVVEFIVQDFQEESFEKLFVTSIDNKKRTIKKILGYLTRNKYGVVPDPSISRYDPSAVRPYNLNKDVPSWVATIVSKAASICMGIDKKMPPNDWKLDPQTSRTWRDMYAEWGADKVMKGSWKNIASTEKNRDRVEIPKSALKYNPLPISDQSTNDNEMAAGKYTHNGGSSTNNTHNDLYRLWLSQMDELTREVKKYIEDEKNFEKYFGNIGNDMLNAVTQSLGQCYDDLLLPNIPYVNHPLPPEFYVYDDSDESPMLSSLTDPINMEKFLRQHVKNEMQSVSLYMRERFLGGSYLAKNLPRIIENRRYYDQQMAGEYEFFDNFWKIYQEGATAWEPIHYKEDPTVDNNTQVKEWKNTTLNALGASNDVEASYKHAENLVKLSSYIKKGRHWRTSFTEQENQNLVTNLYGKEYYKTCFGPNAEFNRADAAITGNALPEKTLAQTEAIREQAFSQIAQNIDRSISLGQDKTVLPNGDIIYGDGPAERVAKEHPTATRIYEASRDIAESQIERLKKEYKEGHFLQKATAFVGLKFLGAVDFLSGSHYNTDIPDGTAIGNATNRAYAGQRASLLIKGLDHHSKTKVNSSNQDDKLASSIARMAIGSKADDLSIRRVYPTFKIYFIEEDQQDSEIVDGKIVRAFDDFYSYSAVQEIKITRSRKIASDLAVIRMTNIGGILMRRRFGEKDPRGPEAGEKQGIFANTNKEHPFERMILQDGVKVQIRLGYASDPDNLESAFLGQIVEISPSENGKILEIMCQGYGAELEAIELGELEDGPIYTSTQNALSSAIIQDSISTFGRQSKFNRFNPAEMRHAWTGGHGNNFIDETNPVNLMRDWADRNMDQHFQKYTFLNYPQDDNIFAPPPSAYATKWMRYYNNACLFRPLKQTPWQIFKEHELRHPGYISMAVPYGHSPRMTMFFGQKMQHYWSRPPSALELYASENAYNLMVRMRGKVAHGDYRAFQGIIKNMKKEMAEKPALVSAMLKDIVLSGAPTKTSQALAKEFGRYKPFRNYHYFDSYHHILKNEIRTSVDGTFNEVEILFFGDEDDIQEDNAKDLLESIQSLSAKEEGVFSVKLDENIPEGSLRSYREEFPSCITVDMARRYAQGIFARHLRDAYKGELIVIGKETLKPYDICYLNDASINMTGPIEVEAVTHIFNRDHGFVSVITPDLCVDVNDMFSATVFDVAGSALNATWAWGDSFVNDYHPVLAASKGLATLAMAAGVKISMWTQDGDPVVPTPLTLSGKPFLSVSLGPNQSSLFLNIHGKWVQYWDDLEDAWHKFDISEELFDARVGFKTKVLSMLGTGAGN